MLTLIMFSGSLQLSDGLLASLHISIQTKILTNFHLHISQKKFSLLIIFKRLKRYKIDDLKQSITTYSSYFCWMRVTISAILTIPSWFTSIVSSKKSHCACVRPSPPPSLVNRCLIWNKLLKIIQSESINTFWKNIWKLPDVTHRNKTLSINIKYWQALW